MPSLRDPEFNLRWAEKHLVSLKCRIDRFNRTHKLNISTEEDLENKLYVIRSEIVPNFDLDDIFPIAITAGDFINRLRASLDHLAWQLALFGTHKPGTGIYFPIMAKDSEDTQVMIAKATVGWPDEAVPIVKSFQPYKAGDLYKTHPLWRLNKLWNIDKHRHIPAHGAFSDRFLHIAIPGLRALRDEWLDGEDVVRLPLALKDKVTLYPDAPVSFKFRDDREGWEMATVDMFVMYQFVANTVFPAFAGFFKQSSIKG